jgi:hypothetical protein
MAQPDIERKHLQYKSMDMTALLAMSILVDEAVKDEVESGRTGYLTLLEGDDEGGRPQEDLWWNGRRWARSVLEPGALGKRKRKKITDRGMEVGDHTEGREEEKSAGFESSDDNSDFEPFVKKRKQISRVEEASRQDSSRRPAISQTTRGREGPVRPPKSAKMGTKVRSREPVTGVQWPTQRKSRVKSMPLSAEFVVDSSDEMDEVGNKQSRTITSKPTPIRSDLSYVIEDEESVQQSSTKIPQS